MFKVEMTPEDVNGFVKEAIMKSMLGEKLSEAVNEALKDALDGYNSPVQKLVKEAMQLQILEVLRQPEQAERIKLAVGKICTEKFLTELTEAAVANAMRSMTRDY